MNVESFRGFVASIVAGLLALGSLVLAYLAWTQPTDPNDPESLALIFGMLGTAFGASSSFLFVQDAGARASRATERATLAANTQTNLAPAIVGVAGPLDPALPPLADADAPDAERPPV